MKRKEGYLDDYSDDDLLDILYDSSTDEQDKKLIEKELVNRGYNLLAVRKEISMRKRADENKEFSKEYVEDLKKRIDEVVDIAIEHFDDVWANDASSFSYDVTSVGSLSQFLGVGDFSYDEVEMLSHWENRDKRLSNEFWGWFEGVLEYWQYEVDEKAMKKWDYEVEPAFSEFYDAVADDLVEKYYEKFSEIPEVPAVLYLVYEGEDRDLYMDVYDIFGEREPHYHDYYCDTETCERIIEKEKGWQKGIYKVFERKVKELKERLGE